MSRNLTVPGRRPRTIPARERRPLTLSNLFSGSTKFQSQPRTGDDERDTAATVRWMAQLAKEDSRAESIRELAYRITRSAYTSEDQAAAIWAWVREHVRFREDDDLPIPARFQRPLEVLIRPIDLVAMREPAGDCDDFSMLTAALLLAVGIEPRFVTIAAETSSGPNVYSHVYVRAYLSNGSIALDTSHGSYPGWQALPMPRGKIREWRLDLAMQPQLGQLDLRRISRRYNRQGAVSGLRAIEWGKIFQTGVETGSKIAIERFAVPPRGTYRQTAKGDIEYYQPEGGGTFAFPGVGLQTGGGGALIVGVGLLLGGILLIRVLTSGK